MLADVLDRDIARIEVVKASPEIAGPAAWENLVRDFACEICVSGGPS